MLAGHFPRPIVEEIRRAKKSEQVIDAIGIDKELSQQLLELANSKQKSPKLLAEYFIKLGLNTVKFYGSDAKVQFDIDNL
jgi:hypothetical protein